MSSLHSMLLKVLSYSGRLRVIDELAICGRLDCSVCVEPPSQMSGRVPCLQHLLKQREKQQALMKHRNKPKNNDTS